MSRSTDLVCVECEYYAELLSAYLDGETDAGEARDLNAHLDGCVSCRNWLDVAARVTRLARLRPAEPWPDVTDAVLGRFPDGIVPIGYG